VRKASKFHEMSSFFLPDRGEQALRSHGQCAFAFLQDALLGLRRFPSAPDVIQSVVIVYLV
jgi:hypothetical protein